MSSGFILTLVLLVILACWTVGAYNRLVRLRGAIGAAFLQVDTLLTQRHDGVLQLAALAAAADSSLDHHMLDAACRQARAALDLARRYPGAPGPIASLALAEQVLDASLERLIGAVAPQHGAALQTSLDELTVFSSQLTLARQQFNAAVVAYNQAVQQAPTHLLCGVFGFGRTAELPDNPAATTPRIAAS